MYRVWVRASRNPHRIEFQKWCSIRTMALAFIRVSDASEQHPFVKLNSKYDPICEVLLCQWLRATRLHAGRVRVYVNAGVSDCLVLVSHWGCYWQFQTGWSNQLHSSESPLNTGRHGHGRKWAGGPAVVSAGNKGIIIFQLIRIRSKIGAKTTNGEKATRQRGKFGIMSSGAQSWLVKWSLSALMWQNI